MEWLFLINERIMHMEKKEFNSENIVNVIEDWTLQKVSESVKQQETLLEDKLMPELKKEMAVQEMQERELVRMQGEHDIRNLAAKFVLSIKGGLFEEAYQCFALESEDVYANVEKYGIYEGKEKLHEYFVDYYKRIGGREGCFIMHELTNPIVELAKDGNTAKAMFTVEGIFAVDTDNWMAEHEEARSMWQFGPWYMEFKKEKGEWKIWHLVMFDEVETTYEVSWSELASHNEILDRSAPKPSRPVKEKHYFHTGRVPYLHQEPPVPYRTYKGQSMSCAAENY